MIRDDMVGSQVVESVIRPLRKTRSVVGGWEGEEGLAKV